MTQINKRNQIQSGDCCSGLANLLSPKLFKALSDPRRVMLLIRLAEARKPCTIGELADGSGIDMSVVSRHLAMLRESGIIKCEKQGKEVLCIIQTGVLASTLRCLADALEACCPDSIKITTKTEIQNKVQPT